VGQVLYRKYRSQTFSQVYGQDSVINVLLHSVNTDNISHAYLFSGPRGTGKTSTARIFAKAVNCNFLKDGDPCNKCDTCNAINNGQFLDLIEIDGASNRGIDEIRQLKENVNFVPTQGKYKIYIIDEVHMLTTEAFNALLKTLEEPPAQIIFILATTEAHKLPLTIISRVQRFDFKLAEDKFIELKLKKILDAEKVNIEDEALKLLISSAEGSFRDGESILEKVLNSTDKKSTKIITVSQ